LSADFSAMMELLTLPPMNILSALVDAIGDSHG
jgi:hypothetical protein